ncbi:RNA polymerase sigma factor [Streptomyces jeddahensis]|uniref:RNA polymerase sigma factor n=1 Tax=Streptomyces jeddahensis TaxID=1716141 RepID=A0A177HMK7_9ACTN|nr:sigma-70 family RNA polymerase sigma factor [Streptomyces jeddahensis]OAH12221.1 RNA polymerase sigma factor [Streptomyces jeddahensis]
MCQIPDSGRSGVPADRWQQIWSHREQLLTVARRRSTSPQDAEDAVHEAMARAAERPYLDGARLGAWLTAVTVRLCIDQHRQLNRDTGIRRRVGSVLAAPSAVPHEEAVCDRAEARWLACQGSGLPEKQLEALRLKAQDLDVAQVAQRMGLTYKAAESLLGRARRTLREALAATLAVVTVWVWRGRPRLDGGTPAAVPTAVLASAGTLVIAGLVLVSPPGTDEGFLPRPDRERRSDAVFVSSPEEPSARPSTTSAADSVAELVGVPALPEPASKPVGAPGRGDGPVEGDGSVPEQPVPGVPAAELPSLPNVPAVPSVPSVPPLPVPVEPGDALPSVAVPGVPGVVSPASPTPLPLD